ncbi:MAG: CotH kinase family protein [Candidatus Ornithospirochaeta sp.]
MKRLISVVLCVLLLISCSSPEPIIEEEPPKDSPTAVPTRFIDNLSSYTDDSGEVVFTWDVSEDFDFMDIEFSLGGKVIERIRIDGDDENSVKLKMTPGEVYSYCFTPYSKEGEKGKEYVGSRQYLEDPISTGLPQIIIETENYVWPECDFLGPPQGSFGLSITNDEYVYMKMSFLDVEGNLLYESSNQARIKIRGNTSAVGDKKPYKIKLEKKVDLLSFVSERTGDWYKDKEWVLLTTGTTVNTAVGFAVNELVGMTFTPAYQYVDLIINGDYRGTYILIENVKEGNEKDGNQSRCQVGEDGFIIENDVYWWNEDLFFRTDLLKKNFTFKYPDVDEITDSQIAYIKEVMNAFEKSISKDDDSYCEYIDVDSFVSWALVHEYIGQFDFRGSNQYIVKYDSTSDSKLRMETTWDLEEIFINVNEVSNMNKGDFFYTSLLFEKESFMTKFSQLFNDTKDKVVSFITERIEDIDIVAVNESRKIDAARWNSRNVSVEEELNNDIQWLQDRIVWMESQYGSVK